MDSLPTVLLKPGEADRIVAGHPWVYEASILRITKPPEDGSVVQIKDHRQRLIGTGFFNSKSKIRVRVLSSDRTDLGSAFFLERIRTALQLRKRQMPEASSFRVVNAESDFLSGLIIDKYEDVMVIQTSSLGMDQRKSLIAGALKQLLNPRSILERNDMASRKFEGMAESSGVLDGEPVEEVQVSLNGLRFSLNLKSGHKTGLYLDQQMNYQQTAQLAK
ncbi:MAG: rRNA large subunit methyltransferase I, partial [Verrucomicrobia bacterium]|nr:rRNA large subunit methyltransferase I [Verrucomicrobiota bacterium]